MNQLLQENNYVVIDNFISLNQAQELYNIYINDIRLNNIGLEAEKLKDSVCTKNAINVVNYRWFHELHINKIYQLSEFMGESIFPTYHYSRLYHKGALIEKHRDRAACEIGVTLHLGSDGTSWPLYFTKPNNDIDYVDLKPGQAAVYLGMNSVHWRDEYQGNNYAQVFLHYVRARGNYWDEIFDLKTKLKIVRNDK
jgi:hypothetical protein